MDARGHDNSEGVPTDPYGESERADGVEVIHWLADRPWCSGAVGMFGISRGGFTSLRIAALAPEPLKAIVAVCSTDDPYENDGHRMGGSILAVETHARAATALADVARPPDPAHVGQVMWRDLWVKRLETVEPFIHTWLSHPTRTRTGNTPVCARTGDTEGSGPPCLRWAAGTTRTATRCCGWSRAFPPTACAV